MSAFTLVYTRALTVYKSDNAVIPSPARVTSGTTTSAVANKLVCSTATFIASNVAVGDVVYNTTDGTAATITSIDSQTQLGVNANIFSVSPKDFIVYQESQQTGLGNTGCYLYVGGAGNVSVTTIGGDTVLFSGVAAGTILPIQILSVNSTTGGSTTATLFTALW